MVSGIAALVSRQAWAHRVADGADPEGVDRPYTFAFTRFDGSTPQAVYRAVHGTPPAAGRSSHRLRHLSPAAACPAGGDHAGYRFDADGAIMRGAGNFATEQQLRAHLEGNDDPGRGGFWYYLVGALLVTGMAEQPESSRRLYDTTPSRPNVALIQPASAGSEGEGLPPRRGRSGRSGGRHGPGHPDLRDRGDAHGRCLEVTTSRGCGGGQRGDARRPRQSGPAASCPAG